MFCTPALKGALKELSESERYKSTPSVGVAAESCLKGLEI